MTRDGHRPAPPLRSLAEQLLALHDQEAPPARLWAVCEQIRRLAPPPGPEARAAHAYLTWASIRPDCSSALAWFEPLAARELRAALADLRFRPKDSRGSRRSRLELVRRDD